MQPLLAIVGPTASGKSAVAMELARERQAELVSCDSVQVYRGFEVGCAKPSVAERTEVPHHVIDVVEWHEAFDAERYREIAGGAIAGVRARGREPILVGGTGLYLRTLRWGLADAPGADPALRAELYEHERRAPGSLFARLGALDPETAARTDRNNLVRLVRALEITLLSGEPASRVRARHGFAREEIPMRIVAIDWPPATLRRRIEARVAAMLDAGLVAEVERLLAAGVSALCRPMRSVGYKETSEVLLGRASAAGLDERIVRATVSYARRQRTWLRRERGIEPLVVGAVDEALAAIRALKPPSSRAMP